MIGRKIESRWHGLDGEIIRWEPLGSAMCDILVRCKDGREVWCSSTDPAVKPADGLGPLPSRQLAQEWARLIALDNLRAIREQHIRDFHKPWPGLEHGKAILGMSIDGAIKDLERKG